MSRPTDITILTDSRYVAPEKIDPYVKNILFEENLVQTSLEEKGLLVRRLNWDHPHMDWTTTRYILFRSTWDYFERFPEFLKWLEAVNPQTSMINPYEIIRWNLDKHYLEDLRKQGIRIPPTRFIEKGEDGSLGEIIAGTGWKEIILKPVVSGAARHTYRFSPGDAERFEGIFHTLIAQESLMVQEFQHRVITHGEVAFMLLGGAFTHAVIKKARKGDFRVQDDFGGTVERYVPSRDEIAFAEKVVSVCDPLPLYARVDAIWDNQDQMAVTELELIEPELWFRFHPQAARTLADLVVNHMEQNTHSSSDDHAGSKEI
jgi:glutathione synthase/RimK-type ligase-like ATP-grasp enzyme